jgi:hypothetical protein
MAETHPPLPLSQYYRRETMIDLFKTKLTCPICKHKLTRPIKPRLDDLPVTKQRQLKCGKCKYLIRLIESYSIWTDTSYILIDIIPISNNVLNINNLRKRPINKSEFTLKLFYKLIKENV